MEAKALTTINFQKRRLYAPSGYSIDDIAIPKKNIKFDDDFNVNVDAITFGLYSLSLNERKVNCKVSRKRSFDAMSNYSNDDIAIPKKKTKFDDDFNIDLEAITFGLYSLSLDERKVNCLVSRKRRFDAMSDYRNTAIATPEKKIKLDDFNVDLKAITFGLCLSL
jgi:hypothetical protein